VGAGRGGGRRALHRGRQRVSRQEPGVSVFAIRHGETTWSLSEQHTGTTDMSPTANGRRLTQRLRPVLAKEAFARVLTSPLQRTRETCTLAGLGETAVVEDGVVIRFAADDYILTSAEPNLAYFQKLVGYDQAEITDVSADYASLAVQGPRSRDILAGLDPQIATLGFFHHTPAKIGNVPVHVSRTGYTGDLGYEIWVGADGAVEMWDALSEACVGQGVLPVGQSALLMTRIEAGLVLIGVDFHSSRFAFNDYECSTPLELGFAWMFRDLASSSRRFIGRAAIEREIADKTSRWKMVGLMVDWREWDRHFGEAGLIPPKDETPVVYEMMLYDDDGARVGYTTSFMYSPMLQRHIAMARVQPQLAAAGSKVNLELTINHRYHTVAAEVRRPPLFNPARKTA